MTAIDEARVTEIRDVLGILRQRELQLMGAAISRRDWHAMETAYNQGRDRLDALLIRMDRESTPEGTSHER
jgi:hypothetical protein